MNGFGKRNKNHTQPVCFEVLSWPASAPSRQSGIGGVKGHNQNEISFARNPLATACPGSPALWAGSFTFCSPEISSIF